MDKEVAEEEVLVQEDMLENSTLLGFIQGSPRQQKS